VDAAGDALGRVKEGMTMKCKTNSQQPSLGFRAIGTVDSKGIFHARKVTIRKDEVEVMEITGYQRTTPEQDEAIEAALAATGTDDATAEIDSDEATRLLNEANEEGEGR
jgi:hypothetical protein